MKQKRNEKLHGAQSEAELKKQLAAIERAAQAAIESDRSSIVGDASLQVINTSHIVVIYAKI
jgi:hypothetical protein